MAQPNPTYIRLVDETACAGLAEALLKRLFPICRSITGEGVRETFRIIAEHVALDVAEIPSGTEVLDWEIPREWNIRDAFIKDHTGKRIVDFRRSNLHVVSYSLPVHRTMSLEQLRPHLHTLPAQPDAIPYVTSYYRDSWGFCLPHRQYETLEGGQYEVCIDSTLAPGSLTLAEAVLPGETPGEVLLSTYCCHPSMANNELSGPIVATLLYRYLAGLGRRRYTYRFHFGPETIGALAFLARRGEHLKSHLVAGLVVTCCGDSGGFTYKRPRDPRTILDRAVLHALKSSAVEHRVVDFFPMGSDERQYCSPGFDLPVGVLMRSMYGSYPEYHTSGDDLDFISIDSLVETFRLYANVIYVLEHNRTYRNTKPFGEPQMSKYGLYPPLGGRKEGRREYIRPFKYLLNYADGEHDLLDIADRLGQPIWDLEQPVADLIRCGLLDAVDAPPRAADPDPPRELGADST